MKRIITLSLAALLLASAPLAALAQTDTGAAATEKAPAGKKGKKGGKKGKKGKKGKEGKEGKEKGAAEEMK